MDLTEGQIRRFARHIVLKEIGGVGQARLLASRVLVIGAGGLGSPVLLYLAAAGVGTLGIVDDDAVDLSNLQRQILHTTDRIGTSKVESAAAMLAEINPETRVERHGFRLTAENAGELVAAYDLVVDGSDNFATRHLVNEACFRAAKPLVSGAVLQFDGQVTTLKAYLPGDHHPCYACLYPEPPNASAMPTCATAGVLGAVAGVVGSLQATEAVKELLGLGDGLAGQLLLYDGMSVTFSKIRYRRRSGCPVCGHG